MADHYRASVEHLAEVARIEDKLDLAYEAAQNRREAGGRLKEADRQVVGDLHHRLNVELKKAQVHAQLAQTQAFTEFGLRS